MRSYDKDVLFSGEKRGAIDILICPNYRRECHCREICARCGWPIHMSLHGPLFGKTAGSKPYGHKFVKAEDK